MPGEPDYSKLPERLRHGMQRYIEKGIIPGNFLKKKKKNDLSETIGQADDDMIKIIPRIVGWFYWEAPAGCWGSTIKMKKWARQKDQEYRMKVEII